MSLLRLLNIQGIAGIAVALALGVLLMIQKGETRHWRKQSGQFEQLYHQEQVALAGTVANYRAAAEQARASDQANAHRVQAQQAAINKEQSDEFEARIADARARARRLQPHAAGSADPGSRAGAAVPGLSAPSGGPAQVPRQDGLSEPDALTATEQAIQLDELIKWVKKQAGVDVNGGPSAHP
jgi:hypothetical protein